ncbi:MAG TPA: sigma 54-interacting transcriptional regulator [Chitinophagaceae bacterium]|nr:sigma 54-interacting transcriptional regulator [Chitinophagaceae bacterium]
MPKMGTGIKPKSKPVRNEAPQNVLLALSHAITSKVDLIQIIQHSLKPAVRFTDLVITRFDLPKKTFKFFLESCHLNNQDPDFNSLAMQEYPLEDGIQDVVMNSEGNVTFTVKEFAKEGMIYRQFLEKKRIKSLAGMRLQHDGEIVGAILLLSKDEDAFSPQGLQVLETVSHYFARAMLSIIYLEEIQERNNGNEILLAIGEAFSHIRKKEDLLPILKKQLERLSFYNDVAITTVDEDGKTFSAFLINEDNARVEDKDYLAVRNAHNVFPDGVYEIALYAEMPVQYDIEAIINTGHAPASIQFLYANGTRAMVGISLKDKDKPIGVLCLFSDHVISFSPLQLRLAQGIGNQLASAVANIMAQECVQLREAEKSFRLEFAIKMATARDRNGLSAVVKSYLKEIFHVREYIITTPNEDNLTYSYFLHDLSTDAPTDAGFKVITSTAIPIEGSMTGAVLKSNEPVVFRVKDIIQHRTYYFPSRSFWEAAGAEYISGMKLSVANEVVGILWVQPGQVNYELLFGVSAQIAIALSNIRANEKIQRHLTKIEGSRSQLEREKQYLQEQIKDTYNYEQIIGSNQGLRKVFQLVSNVASSDSTVLLLGETGTGKELIATAIHNSSLRRKNLMVKLNCAAMPAHLVESELFGHEKGSFTGAMERRIGKFELASKGTLFLDEIGEVSLEIQSKLLRAIQEKEIERIGGNTVIKTDVRIIAASNRDLKKDVEAGKFRRDLFYRLNVFPITLPPLRERTEDIPLLASFFMNKYAQKMGKKIDSISTAVITDLLRYDWPGNVRELEHIIERNVLMTNGNVITEVALPQSVKSTDSSDQGNLNSLEENERAYILSVLKKTNGRIRGADGAAEILKIPPTTLHSKMKKLGIRKTLS